MPFKKRIKAFENTIVIWEIKETIEELKELLDDKTIETLIKNKYPNEKRQREQLIVHIILKRIFGEGIRVMHRASGAPYLKYFDGTEENSQISISHSNKSIAVAISKYPVGIDIEEIGRNQLELIDKYTNPEEREWINSFEKEEEKRFISSIIWSSKEAMYKLADTEGLSFETDIKVPPFKHTKSAQYLGKFKDRNASECTFFREDDEILVVSYFPSGELPEFEDEGPECMFYRTKIII